MAALTDAYKLQRVDWEEGPKSRTIKLEVQTKTNYAREKIGRREMLLELLLRRSRRKWRIAMEAGLSITPQIISKAFVEE